MDGSKGDSEIGGDGSVPSAMVKKRERVIERKRQQSMVFVIENVQLCLVYAIHIHCSLLCVCVPDCGLSYISQILSELGTASSLKTVSGFLGCGQRSCVCVCVSYILFII